MQHCDDPNCSCNGPDNTPPAPPKAPKGRKDGVPINRLRNEPCPCNSGKKFKKCCMPALLKVAADTGDKFPRVNLNADAWKMLAEKRKVQ